MFLKIKKVAGGDYPDRYYNDFIQDAELNNGVFEILDKNNNILKLKSNDPKHFYWIHVKHPTDVITADDPNKSPHKLIEDRFDKLFEI